MAITYGFFNSVSGDRTYNADQMSNYFKGLVASTGVFENVGGAFQVLAGTGLAVNVQTGKALIDSKWVESDSVEAVTLTAAHATLNRYTAVCLELDVTNREISLVTVDGANATSPVKPAITNTATIKQICLAYVYVAASATSISQAQITDTRPSTLCGWITGLINQVDTSTLFSQWQTAYEQFFAQLQTWKTNTQNDFEAWEAAQKQAFDTWFAALTQELNINTYVHSFLKTEDLTNDNEVVLDMTDYTYDESDTFIVSINGLVATPEVDYTIDGTTPSILLTDTITAEITVLVLKSQIGWEPIV